MKRRIVMILAHLSGVVLFSGCSIFGIRTTKEPPFTVLAQDGNIQIRQYSNMLVAQTTVEAGYDESSSIAFRRLAGYIFGKNKTKQSIAMTAPVYQESVSEKIAMTAPVLQEKTGQQWTMTFVMPMEYTRETLPQPVDPLVVIKEMPGRKIASLRYTGSLSEERFSAKANVLKAWLKEKNYKALSEPRLAGYDPPWTIWFLRRNEVHADIE